MPPQSKRCVTDNSIALSLSLREFYHLSILTWLLGRTTVWERVLPSLYPSLVIGQGYSLGESSTISLSLLGYWAGLQSQREFYHLSILTWLLGRATVSERVLPSLYPYLVIGQGYSLRESSTICLSLPGYWAGLQSRREFYHLSIHTWLLGRATVS